MPATLAQVRKESRRWMDDTRPGNFAVGTRKLNRIIEAMTHDVESDLDSGQTWILAAITITPPANTPPDYVLPTGDEYQNVLDLRRSSDGFILQRLSPERLDQRRWAVAAGTAAWVSAYAIQQSVVASLERLTIRFDVRATSADTIDLLAATSLAAMVDNDAAVIPFPRDFTEGFQRGVAARALRSLSAAQREERGIEPDYVTSLEADYAKALKTERLRLIRLAMAQPREYLAEEWY